MSFLSEPLSPLWSQQQPSSLLPAVAVVTLPLQTVAGVFAVVLHLFEPAVAVVSLPLQAVAVVLAVVFLLFEPAVEVWYAGWQVNHKPAILTSSCTSRGRTVQSVQMKENH
jgi:hypothetical protein